VSDNNGGPIDVKIKVISDDDKEGGSKFDKEQAKLDEAMHIRTLERKEKRVEEANDERKAN
tara:strand:+ start:309 stop:491 length:183 start_codon:yes stop_codon:yes gene_type:complete